MINTIIFGRYNTSFVFLTTLSLSFKCYSRASAIFLVKIITMPFWYPFEECLDLFFLLLNTLDQWHKFKRAYISPLSIKQGGEGEGHLIERKIQDSIQSISLYEAEIFLYSLLLKFFLL